MSMTNTATPSKTSSQVTPEDKIYKNYRAALAAQKDHRAAARRQAARKMTVERYNVSYAQVKEIVARHDALTGITHEHTADYLRELEFQAAQAEYDKNPVPCACGSEEMVRVRYDPFDLEVHGIYRMSVKCFECYLERKYDI